MTSTTMNCFEQFYFMSPFFLQIEQLLGKSEDVEQISNIQCHRAKIKSWRKIAAIETQPNFFWDVWRNKGNSLQREHTYTLHTRRNSLLKYMHKHAYKHIGKYTTTDVKQQTSERIRQSNDMWKNSNNKSCRHNINTSRAYTYTGIASVISVTQRLWCMRYCVSGAPTHMHTAYDKAFRRS